MAPRTNDEKVEHRVKLRLATVGILTALTLGGCSEPDEPRGPLLEMVHEFGQTSSGTNAVASPVFELSGRTTNFEITRLPDKGSKPTESQTVTIYLVAVGESYGTAAYDALMDGIDPDALGPTDEQLFSLPLYEGEATTRTTMKVEKGNAPFDLNGTYRLLAKTGRSPIAATVREIE